MYIPTTIAALVLLTVAMVILRIFWLRLPPRLSLFLVRASIAIIVLYGIFLVTKWSTSSDRLNVFVNWLVIASYELLVLRFSRMSPRWLTVPSTIILLIPLFASSILMPLTPLFVPGSQAKVALGDHLFYEVIPWTNVGGGNAGVTILIYYHPPFAPFLRRKLQSIPFNNQECDSAAASAVVFPVRKIVLGHCPNWPTQPAGALDKAVPLP